MKKHFASLVTLILIAAATGKSQDPCITREWTNSYTTSWIANDGGTQETHAQHWIDYMFVRPDGTLATVCEWDEGGSNVIVYKEGAIVSIPEGSGTGGWGRMSMIGVAMDDQYLYHLQSQHGCDGANSNNNLNGLPQYPPCGDEYTWRTVRRYHIATGGSASFSNGYGYMGDMLLVRSGSGNLVGIAILGNELFVADPAGDSIRVYDKTSLSSVPVRKFKMSGGVGQLSPDNQGGIWMLQSSLKRLVRFSPVNGDFLPQQIVFPDSVVASAFFVDTVSSRILVADNGISQQIKIYTDIYNTPAAESTLGEKYGIFSGLQGIYAPLKLFDIKGIGADTAGNIYVANSAPGGGSVLQAYSPEGNLLWDYKGLVFTATACADPSKPEEVYTFDKKMKLDYTQTTPGSEWGFEAYTLNRFKYPDDPRLHGGFMTSAWIKYIDGRKFLFATDMYASQVAGYRFDSLTDGEVAIPCLFMNVGGWDVNNSYPVKLGTAKDFIWMDLNGDGAIQENEFTYKNGFDNPYSMAVWIDSQGNIWKGVREQGVRFIPLKEVNEKGVPVYDFADSKLLDIANGAAGINGVKRLVYDFETDELYIVGFSDEKPDRKSTGESTDTWWCMGSTICMYKGVYNTLMTEPATNFKNVLPHWRIFIPFFPEGDPKGPSDLNAKSFTVEGDYLFSALGRQGKIYVYKRSNGEYLGEIRPGSSVNNESGWTDIDYSINVSKTADEYLIFNEENAFAKVILYRVKSFETHDTYFPDLVITDVKMMNSQQQVVSKPKPGDRLHFRMTVKNTGVGVSPDGSHFDDNKSIVITIRVKNMVTNKFDAQLLSDTCKSALNPGDSIQLVSYSTSKPFEWNVARGKFLITATVNLPKRIAECTTLNNASTITTDSYDTLFFFKDIVDATTLVNGTAVFSAEVLGSAPITYKWYINDIEQTAPNEPVLELSHVNMGYNQAKIKLVACNSLGCKEGREAVLNVNDPYGASKPGYLLRQVWYGNSGTSVEDLLSLPEYPNNPDSITFISKFEVPTDIADQYGTRVSGWLIPPQTGDYVFRISSDDNGELWLSTDSLPENLSNSPIAFVPDWTDPREFDKYAEQTSEPVYLEEGMKYYTEAFFKEEAGGDNLAVEWVLPDDSKESPIPSERLAFYSNNPVNIRQTLSLQTKVIEVYPNPVNNKLFLWINAIEAEGLITIVNIQGKVVFQEAVQLNDLTVQDVSQLPDGLYTVSLSTRSNMYAARFLKSSR
jgi:hypothetical protein